MNTQSDHDQPDLFSEYDDLNLAQYLLADLHDGLPGKIARLRQIVDLGGMLSPSGTLLFGGEVALAAWEEARWSFVHANFAATVMLCQGLAEHTLAAFLDVASSSGDFPQRISFSETLRRCMEKIIISENDAADVRQLMNLRNPLSHYRNLEDSTSLSRRAISTLVPAQEHLRRDATLAIQLATRILALPAFRVG